MIIKHKLYCHVKKHAYEVLAHAPTLAAHLGEATFMQTIAPAVRLSLIREIIREYDHQKIRCYRFSIMMFVVVLSCSCIMELIHAVDERASVCLFTSLRGCV